MKEMLYGTLRWYSKMYWILQKTSERDLATSTPQIRAALLMYLSDFLHGLGPRSCGGQ